MTDETFQIHAEAAAKWPRRRGRRTTPVQVTQVPKAAMDTARKLAALRPGTRVQVQPDGTVLIA